MVSSGEKSTVFIGRGVDPVAERKLSGAFNNLIDGRGLEYVSSQNIYSVVLGKELFKLLNLSIGDSVALMGVTVYGGINALDAEVVGVVDSGSDSANKVLLEAPLGLAQELLLTDKVSRLVVEFEENNLVHANKSKVIDSVSDFEIRDWEELSPFYGQLLNLYTRQFSVFGLILGIVVVLTISNSILMNLYERKKSIATLFSMGLPSRLIKLSFMYEGAILSLFSGICGVILAFLLIKFINFMEITMPPPPGGNSGYTLVLLFDAFYSLIIISITTVLGTLAALIAVSKITKMNIIKAINDE